MNPTPLKRRRTLPALAGGWLVALALLPNAGLAADQRYYDVDSRPKVFINWQTFEDNGIASTWKGPVTDAVINAYTRWSMVAGARVRPQFRGYTTRTSPNSGEIIVSMNEKHATSTRIGSAFGDGYSKVKVVLHRKSGATNTPWNWVPYWAQAGEVDMQAVLTHEIGHALGIWDHKSGARDTMNGGYQWLRQRFGPNSADVATLRSLYGVRNDDRVRMQRSTDQGASWSSWSTNLTGLNVSTSMDPAALRDLDRAIFFYTTTSKKPAWIIGNRTGSSFDTAQWWVFGGESSFYGMSGHGYGDEYMMAWVDPANDDMVIRVVRSTDGGTGWHWRNPPTDSTTIGTPAVRRLGADSWILAYAKLDLADASQTGRVVARVSTNDGASWGPEIVLRTFYRAMSGVNISDSAASDVRLGFSWARRSTNGSHLLRTIRSSLSGSTLSYSGMMYDSRGTRTQPVLGATSQRHLLGYREQNYLTTIDSLSSTFSSSSWSGFVSLPNSTTTNATPALAASENLWWAFLYYLQE